MTIGRRDNEDAYTAEVEADLAVKNLKERIAAANWDTPADELRALSDEVLKWFGWTVRIEYGQAYWIGPNLEHPTYAPHPLASLDDAAALMPEGVAVTISLPFDGDSLWAAWRTPEMMAANVVRARLETAARVLAAMAAKEMEG